MGLLFRRLFGQAVGGSQRQKRLRVGLHQRFQPPAQDFRPGIQGSEIRLHRRVLLFAHGQAAHHIAQGHTGRAYKGRCTAAARGRGFAGKALQKALTARFCQFHDRFLPR